MDAIATLGIAQARGAVLILGAVEHDELAAVTDHRRIKGSRRFPSVALRRNDGIVRHSSPGAKRPVLRRQQPRGKQDKQAERADPVALHGISLSENWTLRKRPGVAEVN